MSTKKQAPASAEEFRKLIKMVVDDISDVNTLWHIYTIAYGRWRRSVNKNA